MHNTSFLDHFWKLGCPKRALRCGTKHILKPKCAQHAILGPFLEVGTSKKCRRLRREAHFDVQNHSWTTFGSWDVEKVRRCGAKHILKSKCAKNTILGPLLEVGVSKKCTLSWREAHLKSKCTKHTILGPLWGCRKSARRCGAKRISKSKR